jgi:hypothetical protein
VKFAQPDRKHRRRKTCFEALESRQLMSATPLTTAEKTGIAWIKANVKTAAISTLAQNDFQDGVLSRSDMMSIFSRVEQAGTVTAKELADLKAIVNHTAFFTTDNYVQVLAQDVAVGNTANAHYQGAALGNLAAGNAASKLTKLVDKWFLGTDLPVATSDWVGTNGQDMTFGYSQASGQLFVQQAGDSNAVAYTDIEQGGIGDCYFLSSLAETALHNPSAITNMFIVNGDGTYTVRFIHGSLAQYVTVNAMLPTEGGELVFDGMGHMANSPSNELWVELAEKAYVQMNQSGWIRAGLPGNGQNTYNAISGGCMFMALNQITGQSTTETMTAGMSFAVFSQYVSLGKSICLGSVDSPSDSEIVGDHAYAVLSVDTVNQTVTVYNPWGINNGHDSGVITLTWIQVMSCFDYLDRTV